MQLMVLTGSDTSVCILTLHWACSACSARRSACRRSATHQSKSDCDSYYTQMGFKMGSRGQLIVFSHWSKAFHSVPCERKHEYEMIFCCSHQKTWSTSQFQRVCRYESRRLTLLHDKRHQPALDVLLAEAFSTSRTTTAGKATKKKSTCCRDEAVFVPKQPKWNLALERDMFFSFSPLICSWDV